jgi:ferredoxin hydrogenase
LSKHQFTDERIAIESDNPSIMRHEELCIKCGACKRVCEKEIAVGRLYDLESTGDKPICVHCGQCANACPTDSITETYEYEDVKKAIADPDKIVIFNTSPSVRVSIGEAFGMQGAFLQGKMVAALRTLGANYVLDTNFGADLTITEEASELVTRVVNKSKPLPQFTSCCPAWVKFVETYFPHLTPHISSVKSPIGMQGPTVKTYFAKKTNIDPKRIVNVAVTPCTAKKFEIRREEMCDASKELGIPGMRDMDHVITARELIKWIKEAGINFSTLEESGYDNLMGEASGSGVIFGNTGGVMEAAARSAYYYVTGKNPGEDFLQLTAVRGMEKVRSATVNIAGTPVRVAIVHGLGSAKKLLEDITAGKKDFDFLEVMSCRGGCIGGGGQPKTTIPMDDTVRKARIDALYGKDRNMPLRFSHDNPEIIAVYKEHYEKPLSPAAERMLHTTYHSRSSDLGPKGAVEKQIHEKAHRCKICKYVHAGEVPDGYTCVKCSAPKALFELMAE